MAVLSLDAARRYRRLQQALTVAFIRDFIDLWVYLDFERPNETLPVWLRLVSQLIKSWRPRFAEAAVRYYQEARSLDIDGSAPAPPAVPELSNDRLVANMYKATISNYLTSIDRGFTPEQAREKSLIQAQGAASLLAQEAGRDTIQESIQDDRQALGWMRVTDGDPCSFCAMLASRGAVYESEEAALSYHDAGEGYHPNCGCTAMPVFTRDQEIPQFNRDMKELWKKATEGYSGRDALNAFRRKYEAGQRERAEQEEPAELDEAA